MNRKTIVTLCIGILLLGSYLIAPFIFFPHMFASKEPSIWGKVWNRAYAPIVSNLESGNWYKVQFTKMTERLCEQYPSRCDAPENK